MPKKNQAAIYLVSPDAEKIAGLEYAWPSLKIVTNKASPYLQAAQGRGVAITFLDLPEIKKTSELLESAPVQKLLGPGSRILVFKNLPKIEKIARANDWQVLMPAARFINLLEDKIHFTRFCEQERLPQLPSRIMVLNDFVFSEPSVVQARRGHAGESTFFIKSAKELEKLKRSIGRWVVKITPLMKLPTFSLDLCVGRQRTYQTQPFYQITGDPRLNPLPGGTGGIDLDIAQRLEKKTLTAIAELGETVGESLRRLGYRGIAGIDFLVNEANGKLYLIECNPRMLSNLGFITRLQAEAGELPLLAIHILELLGEKVEQTGAGSPLRISQVKSGRFELPHPDAKLIV